MKSETRINGTQATFPSTGKAIIYDRKTVVYCNAKQFGLQNFPIAYPSNFSANLAPCLFRSRMDRNHPCRWKAEDLGFAWRHVNIPLTIYVKCSVRRSVMSPSAFANVIIWRCSMYTGTLAAQEHAVGRVSMAKTLVGLTGSTTVTMEFCRSLLHSASGTMIATHTRLPSRRNLNWVLEDLNPA